MKRPTRSPPPKPASPRPERAAAQSRDDHGGRPSPIVGIGASAGGLEALEIFLKHVPKNSGPAFVIVQHLDPTHKGILAEFLQRCTAMPVAQIKDRTKI